MKLLAAPGGRPRAALLACIAGTCVLHAGPAAGAPKTDVVVLVNGDRITGEIKGLEHNRLRYGTDHMGTIYIEWDKIARITSAQYLQLERADGSRDYGQLVEAGDDAVLAVRNDPHGRPEVVAMSAVVRAQPIVGGNLIDRLDGYLSAGLDATKANDRRSVDLAAGVSSRSQLRQWSIDGSVNLTDDSAAETSERYELQGSLRRLGPNRAFRQAFGGFERNSELELNLRTLFGGGVGRYFVQTNSAEWVGGVGLAYSHENYADGEVFDSVEAVLTTSFSLFRYDFPETDIGGALSLLPSLTESGRYRAEADLRAKYEFVDDLYFEIRLYGSYDSEPPLDDAGSSDYGVVTSLGYSF